MPPPNATRRLYGERNGKTNLRNNAAISAATWNLNHGKKSWAVSKNTNRVHGFPVLAITKRGCCVGLIAVPLVSSQPGVIAVYGV